MALTLVEDRAGHLARAEARSVCCRAREVAGGVLGQDPGHELMRLYAEALRALGNWLGDRDALGTIAAARGSADRFAASLAAGMPFFDDPGFYKRAQITANDLVLAGVGDALRRRPPDGVRRQPASRTCCGWTASSSMRRSWRPRVDAGRPLPAGGEMEREIRACTVHACEAAGAWRLGVAPRTLDNWLWNRGQTLPYSEHPVHLTRTVFYSSAALIPPSLLMGGWARHARPARDEAAPLLGRAQEQSLLTSLLDEVGERGQALVLRGEPGIGKSRLLSVAAQTARDRGMTVLTAAGVQSEAHLPFAGLHQLLRPVRERAVELPPIQRDALDAAFGLTREVAPEHYRIAMAVARPRRRRSPAMPRCCSSSRTLTGSTPRPRTCSRSSLGESSPTRSSCWPPPVTATPRRSPMRGCRSTGSPASTTRRPRRCSTRRPRAFR